MRRNGEEKENEKSRKKVLTNEKGSDNISKRSTVRRKTNRMRDAKNLESKKLRKNLKKVLDK